MMTLPARPTLAHRFAWTLRLSVTDARRSPRVTVAVTLAFALATLAGMMCAMLALSGREAGARGTQAGVAPESSVEVVAFLRGDLAPVARDALADALRRLAGVAGVRVLGSDEALARMRADLGARASVLDGVEEGFLPTTLEVSLRPGPDGAGRADAIAWRLGRREGVTDVDVLRSAADERLARASRLGRSAARAGLIAGGAAVVVALVLAGLATRKRRADARILVGLGFTSGAIAAPASIASAVAAAAGAACAVACGFAIAHVPADSWLATIGFGFVGARARATTASVALVGAVVLGAVLGWWGACPSRRDWDEVVAGD